MITYLTQLRWRLSQYKLDWGDLYKISLGLFVTGIILRGVGLTTSAIWFDEAVSLNDARLPMFEMVRARALDYLPPLWELILWVSIRIFRDHELGLRLPAFLCSVCSLVLVYGFIKKHPIKNQVSVMALALLPGLIWVAQDGRTYALVGLLYLAGIWFVMRRRWWTVWAICGLLVYCHIVSWLFVAGLMALIVLRERRDLWTANRIGLGTIAVYLPWLPVTLTATSYTYWIKPLTISSLALAVSQAVTALTVPMWLLVGAALLVGVCVLLALMISLEGIAARPLTITPEMEWGVIAVVPLVVMIVISLTSRNISQYRTLGPMLLPLYVWFGITLTPRRLTVTTWVIPACWALLIVAGLIGWSPTTHGGSMREAGRFVQSQLQPGDVIYHASTTSLLPMREYLAGEHRLIEKPDDIGLHPGLYPVFGIQLEAVPPGRKWIVWARDPIIPAELQKQMAVWTSSAHLMWRVEYWQAAPIEIYLED